MAVGYLILDAGHNEYVEGKEAPDKSMREWEFNNVMQYKIKKKAESLGIVVYLTNPDPAKKKEIGLRHRCNLANDQWAKWGKPKNCIFLSLHSNSATNTSARGVEVFVAGNSSSGSRSFATDLNDEIFTTVFKLDNKFRNRGMKTENFTVIKYTNMQCCLVEYAFYSNKQDLLILKNKREELADATMRSICRKFGIKYNISQPSIVQPPKVETIPEKNEPVKINGKPAYYLIAYDGETDRTAAEVLTWGLGEANCILVESKNFKPKDEIKSFAIGGAACAKVEADVEIEGSDRWETLNNVRKYLNK